MKKTLFSIAIAAMTLLSSCSLFKSTEAIRATAPAVGPEKVTEKVVPAEAAAYALEGEWAVMELNGRELKINGDNRPMITFSPSFSTRGVVDIIGFNGCNYINGSYKVGEKNLEKAGEFISSLMACPDAPYETEVNQALDAITSYSLTKADGVSTLKLADKSGRTVMVLRNHSLSFINGAWKVVKINNRTVPTSADVKVVIDTQTLTIHGNAGCNLLNGNVVVNLDVTNGIEFSNLSTTRLTCPDIETESAFLVALEEVKSAKKVDADNASLLNDKGAAIIELEKVKN